MAVKSSIHCNVRMQILSSTRIWILQDSPVGSLSESAGAEDVLITGSEDHEFPAQVEKFITNFEYDADMTNLQDIIAWNVKHKKKAMPERKPP